MIVKIFNINITIIIFDNNKIYELNYQNPYNTKNKYIYGWVYFNNQKYGWIELNMKKKMLYLLNIHVKDHGPLVSLQKKIKVKYLIKQEKNS